MRVQRTTKKAKNVISSGVMPSTRKMSQSHVAPAATVAITNAAKNHLKDTRLDTAATLYFNRRDMTRGTRKTSGAMNQPISKHRLASTPRYPAQASACTAAAEFAEFPSGLRRDGSFGGPHALCRSAQSETTLGERAETTASSMLQTPRAFTQPCNCAEEFARRRFIPRKTHFDHRG